MCSLYVTILRMIIYKTSVFDKWLTGLRDQDTVGRIVERLTRMSEGNFGDHKSVGEGISELCLSFGSGYRIYYTIRGNLIVYLLVGGDKSSQRADIQKAKDLAKEIP